VGTDGLLQRLGRVSQHVVDWVEAPQPVVRLVLVRALAPLWIVGFMSDRLLHADEWISTAGFRVPEGTWNTNAPVYIPGVPVDVAWAVAALLVASALVTSVGLFTRWSALVFSATLVFVALADQVTVFTVTRIGPVIAFVIAMSPSGSRLSVDAWIRRRKGGGLPKKIRPVPGLRFFQLFLPLFYSGSGLAKAHGDWLKVPMVLWGHLFSSYQTEVTVLLGTIMPVRGWTFLQGLVLTFEVLAPLWFALRWTRPVALVVGLGMHLMIALMFGPVIWFSFLMMTLLLAAFAPGRVMSPLEALAQRFERAARASPAC
jgi:Vitamin K-dependent gamma-carboxylase